MHCLYLAVRITRIRRRTNEPSATPIGGSVCLTTPTHTFLTCKSSSSRPSLGVVLQVEHREGLLTLSQLDESWMQCQLSLSGLIQEHMMQLSRPGHFLQVQRKRCPQSGCVSWRHLPLLNLGFFCFCPTSPYIYHLLSVGCLFVQYFPSFFRVFFGCSYTVGWIGGG